MFGRKNVNFVFRMAPEEESGRYAIAEFGIVNSVEDEEYVTSTGLAFRRDHMPTDVRRARDEALTQRRLSLLRRSNYVYPPTGGFFIVRFYLVTTNATHYVWDAGLPYSRRGH